MISRNDDLCCSLQKFNPISEVTLSASVTLLVGLLGIGPVRVLIRLVLIVIAPVTRPNNPPSGAGPSLG
jgi:hypothetical protein